MSFKELCCKLGTELDNEFIRLRADQAELGQQLTERINGVANHVKTLDTKVTALDAKVTAIDTKIDTKFAEIDARFESMDARFESIDARFESIDARFESMDARFNDLQGNQSAMMHILIDIQRKVSAN
jgi:chaperonin cofactor prefoldin